MIRSFPSAQLQQNSIRLRNEICRLGSPKLMAEVSSHLRNFAVAEVVGFIGMLDGHPGIHGAPAARKGPAAFQQVQGTTENPLAHAIPSDLLLQGKSLASFYKTEQARNALERVFGMGVMAPEDWEKAGSFTQDPRQNNVVDTIAERHHYSDGLVAAFEACAKAAVAEGSWCASGKRKHDLGSLDRFIAGIYEKAWVPAARLAYRSASLHFTVQMQEVGTTNADRLKVLQQRLEIVQAQLQILEKEKKISPEAAKNVWKFAATENWN